MCLAESRRIKNQQKKEGERNVNDDADDSANLRNFDCVQCGDVAFAFFAFAETVPALSGGRTADFLFPCGKFLYYLSGIPAAVSAYFLPVYIACRNRDPISDCLLPEVSRKDTNWN